LFARFGRVGKVYIPTKLDKQGRRFGFVKYRDVKDAREQLDRISAIWVGSFKLRVNLPRFAKGEQRRDEQQPKKGGREDIPESSKGVGSWVEKGKTFRAALVDIPKGNREDMATEEVVVGSKTTSEVVWEVEEDVEAVAKLKGSMVGFLSEFREHHVIQQNFIMDGYSNFKITPLGHLKVLLSSTVEGEVQEVVSSVGWWSTWFDRFEV
jgi:hypothetical protein